MQLIELLIQTDLNPSHGNNFKNSILIEVNLMKSKFLHYLEAIQQIEAIWHV